MVSAWLLHACGLPPAAKAIAGVRNTGGQLGTAPVRKGLHLSWSAGHDLRPISAGRSHTCGLTASGSWYCLGPIPAANSSTPVAVSRALTFADVTAGYAHNCGVTTAGAGYCWGTTRRVRWGNGSLSTTRRSFAGIGRANLRTHQHGRLFRCGSRRRLRLRWGDNASGLVATARILGANACTDCGSAHVHNDSAGASTRVA